MNSHENESNSDKTYSPRQEKSSFQPTNDDHEQTDLCLSFSNTTTVESPDYAQPDTTSNIQPPLNVPSAMTNDPQTSTKSIRAEAVPFIPASKNTNSNETETVAQRTTPATNDSEAATTNSFIYDLKKYKHDYFISKLSCSFDFDKGKFSSPTGICTLDDDRLLVANYDSDSLVLMDVQGVVKQIYRDLKAPKDLAYYSTNPAQVAVATKKELVLLDLETSTVVARSTIRGFYPWNVQFIKEQNTFAACDPSGERIVFLDKNLAELGDWSYNEQNSVNYQFQTYQKNYPYAAYFFPGDTSFVLTNRENVCQLREVETATGSTKRFFDIPPRVLAYSIYVDSAKNCLIADKLNHRLVSVDRNSKTEEYRCKSIHEPYSMTFLSDGTLCVTTWNKSFGTNGGIAIISEVDRQDNQQQ